METAVSHKSFKEHGYPHHERKHSCIWILHEVLPNDLKPNGKYMSHRGLFTVTNRSAATGMAPKARLYKELLPVFFSNKQLLVFPLPRSMRLPRPSNFLPESTLGAVSSKTQVLTAGNDRQSGSPFQLPLYDPSRNLTVTSSES